MRAKRYGQYVDVSRSEIVGHNGTKYRVIIYGAIDAFGLIGPEFNGVAVLDEDAPRVIVDCMAETTHGHATPTRRQLELFKKLVLADYPEFHEIVSKHEKYRGWLPEPELEMV